jgi:hypothetical protein
MRSFLPTIALFAFVQGCTGTTDTDAGDASRDVSPSDVVRDSQADAPPDAAPDAEPPVDVANDTGADASTDTPLDTATDGGDDVAADDVIDAQADVASSDDGSDASNACAAWTDAPVVGTSIAIPAEEGRFVVSLHAAASGTQDYRCVATTAGGATTYAWTLTGPDAVLADCTGATIGHHQPSAGGAAAPQWTSTDGSSVIAARESGQTVDSTAVPWLLLRAASTSGTGVMHDVVFVHRVNTVGGVAPSTGCDATHVDDTTSVAYTADYFFYARDTSQCAGWNDPPPSPAPPISSGSVVMHASATGTQNYRCTASASSGSTTYAWAFLGPDATLSDCTGATIAHHLAADGNPATPIWVDNDASTVIAVRDTGVTPDPTAIPWLSLHATANAGRGILSNVTNVQRVATTGGLVPTTACDASNENTEVHVPYTAQYYFWGPSNACDTWNDAPTVDPAIAIPSSAGSERVVLHAGATGSQNYRCTANTSGGATTYAWAAAGPDAALAACGGSLIGRHRVSSGGPSAPEWTNYDASRVVASRTGGVTVDSTAIPWLLLSATSTSGTGVLTPVQFVQRVNTVAGLAPTSGCDSTHDGALASIPYRADYFFFAP